MSNALNSYNLQDKVVRKTYYQVWQAMADQVNAGVDVVKVATDYLNECEREGFILPLGHQGPLRRANPYELQLNGPHTL